MKNQKRELLTKKLEEAKKEVRMKEEKVRDILREISQLDQIEAQKVLKKYHLTPGELDEILAKYREENERLKEEIKKDDQVKA